MPNNTASIELELPTLINFEFPVQGISENWARAQQPSKTTPDCLNVMPYDLTARARGGQRPGFSLVTSDQYGAASNTARAQLMMQVTSEIAGVRSEHMLLIAGGLAYAGTALGTLAQINTSASFTVYDNFDYTLGRFRNFTNSAALTFGAASGYNVICGAMLDGAVYLADGVTTTGITIDFTTEPPAWSTPSLTAGVSPWTTKPTIVVAYRKRLIVAGGNADNPENFYASRVGKPSDWDYSKPDPSGAFAGNGAKAGQIGEPITALIPFGDDAMLIGCDRSIWLMNGDPKSGGRIDVISRNCGILSQSAHAFDPAGNLYFVGTTGLFMMQRGLFTPVNLSDQTYNSFFVGLTAAKPVINLVWDRDKHGLWIFATTDPEGSSKHLWWDQRTGGFFPQQLPNVMGPTAALMWSPPGGGQTLVLGGWQVTGTSGCNLYKLDSTVSTDAGSAVNAYVYCGPLRPGSISQEAMLEACDFITGELPGSFTGSFFVNYTLRAASSADAAYESPHYTAGASFSTSGRQMLQRTRLRGESFFLLLQNGSSNCSFSIEQATGHFRPGGRVRKLV